MITQNQLMQFESDLSDLDALIVRTLPNPEHKLHVDHSGTNPPYFEPEALSWLVAQGISHLLTDQPSVDPEEDDGKILAHKRFWEYPETENRTRTITELIYVPDELADGLYLLDIQIAPFPMDAAPSRPMVFALT